MKNQTTIAVLYPHQGQLKQYTKKHFNLLLLSNCNFNKFGNFSKAQGQDSLKMVQIVLKHVEVLTVCKILLINICCAVRLMVWIINRLTIFSVGSQGTVISHQTKSSSSGTN